MKIGFTGTQVGMTGDQAAAFGNYILNNHEIVGGDELHHGDCIGADQQAHELAYWLGLTIVIHPPNVETKRAFCGVEGSSVRAGVAILRPKPYLARNRDIVDETEFLIATPRGTVEELRSGTWSTMRYAERKGKLIVVIWPNGDTELWTRRKTETL